MQKRMLKIINVLPKKKTKEENLFPRNFQHHRRHHVFAALFLILIYDGRFYEAFSCHKQSQSIFSHL